MAEIIRRIEEKDFQEVSALYKNRKSIEELKWLYINPENPNIYNAFVAVNSQNKIIGEIAYSLSIYEQGEKKINGVIPINWKVIPNYKGMAGVLLFKKILSLGDFGIAISGSDTAINLYPLFNLKYHSRISHFYKILDIISLLKHYKRKNFIKTYGMIGELLPSYIRPHQKRISNNVEFIPYNGSNYSEENKANKKVFKKKISKNYIDWLLSCPILKTYGFRIIEDHKSLGICVLYIQKIDKLKFGRIVHLPDLGEDKKLWENVIYRCTDFFKKQNCSLIMGLAHNKMNYTGYKISGYKEIQKHAMPLFIKDRNKILRGINLKDWLIQYSEGDKGYRNF